MRLQAGMRKAAPPVFSGRPDIAVVVGAVPDDAVRSGAHGLAGDEVAHAAALLVVDHDGRLAVHRLHEIDGNLQTAVRHRPLMLRKTHQLPILRRGGQSRMGRLGLVLEKGLALARLPERTARPGNRDPHAQLVPAFLAGNQLALRDAKLVDHGLVGLLHAGLLFGKRHRLVRSQPELEADLLPFCRRFERGNGNPHRQRAFLPAQPISHPRRNHAGDHDHFVIGSRRGALARQQERSAGLQPAPQWQPPQGEQWPFFSWESNLA